MHLTFTPNPQFHSIGNTTRQNNIEISKKTEAKSHSPSHSSKLRTAYPWICENKCRGKKKKTATVFLESANQKPQFSPFEQDWDFFLPSTKKRHYSLESLVIKYK